MGGCGGVDGVFGVNGIREGRARFGVGCGCGGMWICVCGVWCVCFFDGCVCGV